MEHPKCWLHPVPAIGRVYTNGAQLSVWYHCGQSACMESPIRVHGKRRLTKN